MKLQPDQSDRQTISGHGPGWVSVGAERITHNVVIAGLADRIISLSGGRVASVERNAERKRPQDLSW